MPKIRKYIAWTKLFFDRGRDWLSLIQFLMVTSIFTQLLKTHLQTDFLSSLLITFFSVLGISMVLGFLDLKHGIYMLEFERRAYINPFWARSRTIWEATLDRVRANKQTVAAIKDMVENYERERRHK